MKNCSFVPQLIAPTEYRLRSQSREKQEKYSRHTMSAFSHRKSVNTSEATSQMLAPPHVDSFRSSFKHSHYQSTILSQHENNKNSKAGNISQNSKVAYQRPSKSRDGKTINKHRSPNFVV